MEVISEEDRTQQCDSMRGVYAVFTKLQNLVRDTDRHWFDFQRTLNCNESVHYCNLALGLTSYLLTLPSRPNKISPQLQYVKYGLH